MARFAGAAGLLLAFLLCPGATGGSFVTGVVRERVGDRLVPLPQVRVIARLAKEKYATLARTDSRGRFRLADLPAGRLSFSVQKPGFHTRLINGRPTRSVALTCDDEGHCGQIDFELVLGAVVEGYVLDSHGEPLGSVAVGLRAFDADGRFVRHGGSTGSDDRGYFRIYGVEPGSYRLIPSPKFAYTHGPQYVGEPLQVEVGPGDEISGIQFVMRLSMLHSVSGRVAGVDLADGRHHSLHLLKIKPRDPFGLWASPYAIKLDGRFSLSGVEAGVYIIELHSTKTGSHSTSHMLLGTLDVNRDLTDVELRPVPPTGVKGKIIFEGYPRSDAPSPPSHVAFRLAPADGRLAVPIGADAPDYDFETTNLLPGVYRVQRFGRIPFIKGRRSGDEIVPVDEIVLREGQVESLDLVLSARGGRVSGRVKPPLAVRDDSNGEVASHYLVSLRHGGDDTVTVRTDQQGLFDFGVKPPGRYEICAWRNLREKQVRDEAVWERAGAAVRSFVVEEDTEVEIELTAVP